MTQLLQRSKALFQTISVLRAQRAASAYRNTTYIFALFASSRLGVEMNAHLQVKAHLRAAD